MRKEHWFHRFLKFIAKYNADVHWKVGDTVIDDLTLTVCKVTGVQYAHGRVGCGGHKQFAKYNGSIAIWLDNEYLDGGRHPWEISDPIPEEDIAVCTKEINKYRQQAEQRRTTMFSKQPKN